MNSGESEPHWLSSHHGMEPGSALSPAMWLVLTTLVVISLIYVLLRIQRKREKGGSLRSFLFGFPGQDNSKSQLAKTTQELAQHVQYLQEIDRLKTSFISNVTSDLRMPLSIIAGQLEMLLQKSDNLSPAQLDAVHAVLTEASGMYANVSEMLDANSFTEDATRLNCKPHDFTAFISGIVSKFDVVSVQSGVDLGIEWAHSVAEPVVLEFDPDKMEQVFSVLINNAFKFTPSGGRITLKLLNEETPRRFAGFKRLPPMIRIVLSDTGRGIPESQLPYIFDRFYFRHGCLSKVQKGTDSAGAFAGVGLGLSICRSLVELHKGCISVSSDPKTGTSFTLEFPLCDKAPLPIDGWRNTQKHNLWRNNPASSAFDFGAGYDADKQHLNAASESAFDDKPEDVKTILVVEDNSRLRHLLVSMLQDEYRLIPASGGEEGLTRLRQTLPDMVVCDLDMHTMDGLAFVQQYKSDPELRDIPVFILADEGDSAQKLACIQAGAEHYVNKPFNVELLQASIRNYFVQLARMQNSSVKETEGKETGEKDADVQKTQANNAPNQPENNLDDVSASRCNSPASCRSRSTLCQRIEQIISEHLSSINVNELAQQACMERSALYRKVQDEFGLSPQKLILQRRLHHSAELLEGDPSRNISDIAYSSGFNSLSYFSRAFRDQYQCTPNQYRKKVLLR